MGSEDERRIRKAFEVGHPGALTRALDSGAVKPAWVEATLAAARLLGARLAESGRPLPPTDGPWLDDRRAVLLAARYRARLALVELRPQRVRVALKEFVEQLGAIPSERIEAELLQIWSALLAGEEGIDEGQLWGALQQARRREDSERVVELTALAALRHSSEGDFAEALRLGRLASRMARTEELPQPAVLANLVLARVRRLAGAPYLAARIAQSLRSFAPRSWRRWLDWELLVAAGDSQEQVFADGPEPRLLGALLSACAAGDRPRFGELCDEFGRHAAALIREDVRRLRGVLWPDMAAGYPDPALVRWKRGESDDIPYGLGSFSLTGTLPGGSVALVVSESGGAYRLLDRAAPFLVARGAAMVGIGGEGQLRALSALAAVALAGGDGLPEAQLFRRIYGFDFDPSLHRGAFNTVLHRARAVLGGAGALRREGGRVRLSHQGVLLIPDPRCSLGTRDRLLRLLATTPHLGARRISDRLGLPLRSVQAMLRELVDEGVCVSMRKGRAVVYVVQDTTFHEPTQARRRG